MTQEPCVDYAISARAAGLTWSYEAEDLILPSFLTHEQQQSCQQVSGVLVSYICEAISESTVTPPSMRNMCSSSQHMPSFRCPSVSQVIPCEQEEEIRKLYLAMIETTPEHILQELAAPLKEAFALNVQGSAHPERTQPVTALIGDSIVNVDKDVFSIGRSPLCDLQVNTDDKSVSRLNCWVFNLPNFVAIVDGWSLAGTALVDRECSDEELLASKPRARRVFVVPHGEAATLRLGLRTQITLNPKMCIICHERPRAVRLQCGHPAFCAACADAPSLPSCPLCRAVLDKGGVKCAPRAVCAMSYVEVQAKGGCIVR
jgi:hypothetical protein